MTTFSNLSIFLDESGATGNNFLDFHQPFFVQAGFIIQDKNIACVEAIFEAWESKLLKPKQNEIKGSKLFQQINGMKEFEDLYLSICPYILCHTFSILDKKFALCFTSVEAFLDSFYNPLVETNEFFLSGSRQEWAETLYSNLSSDSLAYLNDTIRKYSFKAFTLAHDQIVSDLESASKHELAKKIQACPREQAFSFLAQENKQLSTNAIVFRSHIFSIKKELIKNPPSTCRIYHDQQIHYSSIFKDALDIINSGPIQVVPVSESQEIVLGKMGDWKLSFEESHNSPMIKIADLISSYIMYILMNLRDHKNIGRSSQNLYNLFWAPLLRHVYPDKFNDLPNWYYEGIPVELQKKLIQHLK